MSGPRHFTASECLATMGLCLILSATKLCSEPISVGLAIEDTVVIYGDSTVTSPQVAVLPFAHHVLVLGEGDETTSLFDRNGWTRVETAERLSGWVRSEAVAVAARLRRHWSARDTLYEASDRESPFHVPKYRHNPQDVRLRHIVEDQTWLGLYESESKRILWLPADDYQYEDIYIALSQRYRGLGYDVGILPLHPEVYRESPLGSGRGRELERDPLKSLQVALRLQEIVLPQDTLFSYGEEFILPSNAGPFAADLVHQAYLATGQYERAVEALKVMVKGEPTDLLMGHPAAPMAVLKTGAIYSSYLRDFDRALESYHFVIREYPGVSISGFEWNDWIDIRAAERILELSDSPERLGEESLRIVAASPDSAVQLIGRRGWLRSMGLRGAHETMVDSALSILRRHPSHIRHFFKTPVDFSTALVSEALQLLVEEGEFDLFYRASARFAGQFPDYEAGFFAVAYAAHIADCTNADLEDVLRRHRASSLFPDHGIWDRVTRRHYYGGDGEKRIKTIEEFISYETEIVVPKVELRLGFEDQYPVLDTLALGTPVTVLYSNRPLIHTSFKSIVAVKVRLQDGRVGWIESDEIGPRKESIFLAADQPRSPGWDMHLANAQGNPVFPGPAIERPTIARILPDLSTRDLRFYDVNGDLRLDLIVNLHSEVMALDGTTLEPLFSFGRAEYVVLGEDRLFLKDRQGGFYCYDFISGASPWSRDLDGSVGSEPVVHGGRLYDVIMTMDGGSLSARILCLDATSGKNLWSQELGKGYSSFDIHMVVNDRAVILPMPREPDRWVLDVFALDPRTGRILWRRDRSSVSRFMALDEEHLYGHLGRYVFGAIDLAAGHLAWEYAYAASNPSMRPGSNLIVLSDRVVTGSSRGGLMALTKSDGSLIWTRPSIPPYAMTAVGDMLYVGHGSGAGDSLMALSLHTGATHWQLPLTKQYRQHQQRIVYQSGRLLLDSEYGVAVIADSASIAEGGSREPPPVDSP